MKNVSRYASELVIVASRCQPWEVSKERFIAIVALLSDADAALDTDDRTDLREFFMGACATAAKTLDHMAADERAAAKYIAPALRAFASKKPLAMDVCAVYRACVDFAKQRGLPVYGDGA